MGWAVVCGCASVISPACCGWRAPPHARTCTSRLACRVGGALTAACAPWCADSAAPPSAGRSNVCSSSPCWPASRSLRCAMRCAARQTPTWLQPGTRGRLLSCTSRCGLAACSPHELLPVQAHLLFPRGLPCMWAGRGTAPLVPPAPRGGEGRTQMAAALMAAVDWRQRRRTGGAWLRTRQLRQQCTASGPAIHRPAAGRVLQRHARSGRARLLRAHPAVLCRTGDCCAAQPPCPAIPCPARWSCCTLLPAPVTREVTAG